MLLCVAWYVRTVFGDGHDYFACTIMKDAPRYPQNASIVSEAFEQFFQANWLQLRRYVCRRIPTPEDAEDIEAESFCVLIEYCQTRPEVQHFRPLLYTIAKQRIARYYETRAARVRDVPLEDAPELPGPRSLAHDTAVHEELRAVHTALQSLDEDARELITLRAMVGLEIDEIAELMGLGSAVVRMRLYRARRALKRVIRKGGEGEQENKRGMET